MKIRPARAAAVLTATALTAAALVPGPAAQAQAPRLGKTSLAEVLAADGLQLDDDWGDFDVLDQAVHDVLTAKPDSAVAVLADGRVRLTAFAPTDRAFRKLVFSVTGSRPHTEQQAYDVLATLPVDTVESVLLYHVVPGAPITYRQAKKADGAKLTTANGATLRVDYRRKSGKVLLVDQDSDARNAYVYRAAKNINQGNRQIAHGVSRVLRPFDL